MQGFRRFIVRLALVVLVPILASLVFANQVAYAATGSIVVNTATASPDCSTVTFNADGYWSGGQVDWIYDVGWNYYVNGALISGGSIGTISTSGSTNVSDAPSSPGSTTCEVEFYITEIDPTFSIFIPVATTGKILLNTPLPPTSSEGPDGRLDWDSMKAGPVALYCNDDTLDVYAIDPDSGQGVLAFQFSDWPADPPAENTLLKQVGDISLWMLVSGEFEVIAPASDGKKFAFVFDGCPYGGGGYTVGLEPSE